MHACEVERGAGDRDVVEAGWQGHRSRHGDVRMFARELGIRSTFPFNSWIVACVCVCLRVCVDCTLFFPPFLPSLCALRACVLLSLYTDCAPSVSVQYCYFDLVRVVSFIPDTTADAPMESAFLVLVLVLVVLVVLVF